MQGHWGFQVCLLARKFLRLFHCMAVLCLAVFLFPGTKVALLLCRVFLATCYDAHWIILVTKIYGCLHHSQRVGLVVCSIFLPYFDVKFVQEAVKSLWTVWLHVYIDVSGFAPFSPCWHPCFFCSSGVFGGCGFIYFQNFFISKQGGNKVCLLPLFLWFVEQSEDFHWRIYCTVVLQSGGCLPAFAVVAKWETMLWRAEIHNNSSGLLA